MSQGSVLGSILYLLYTSVIPVLEQNTIATLANVTAILEVGDTAKEAADKLQASVIRILNTYMDQKMANKTQ